MYNARDKRKFGRSDLEVSLMGFGAAPIGNIFRPISEAESEAMIARAWDLGLRYFDTAPRYGHGLSEARCGYSLRWRPRDEYLLSTKVGRVLEAKPRAEIDFAPWVDGLPFAMRYDYSYDGTLRSFEDSLQRLGLERIDVLFIHDVDVFTPGDAQPEMFRWAMEGCARALIRLREEGLVTAIGLGVGEAEVCEAALRAHDFDCMLLAGRYTLLEQEALGRLLPMCEEREVAVVIGGGFNSGILATGAIPGAKYDYAPAPEPILERVRGLEQICHDFDLPLPAAALQFVLAHPCVASIIPGTRSLAQLEQNLRWISHPIPDDFWAALVDRGLLREDAPTPRSEP